MERRNARRTGKRSVLERLESHLERDNYTEVSSRQLGRGHGWRHELGSHVQREDRWSNGREEGCKLSKKHGYRIRPT